MSVLALIPARKGSKGCLGKNLRSLGGKTLIQHAVDCAVASGCEWVEVSTDYTREELREAGAAYAAGVYPPILSHRPPALCADDTPMLDVVRYVLGQFPETSPIDIVVLLQPTQPFRTPQHVRSAIELLQTSGADSVVSVVELPKTHHAWFQCYRVFANQRLYPLRGDWGEMQTRRQEAFPTYIRDGTVYAFRRSTVERYGTIYGQDVRPLVIPPEESCELDTEQDWQAVERRWQAKHG